MKVLTIILGVLLASCGFYCMFTPIATYAAISWIIGASMVVEGIGAIVTWVEGRKAGYANGWTLAGGIVSIVLGAFLLGSFALRITVDTFIAYLIAIWLVVAGIVRIVAALEMRGGRGQIPMGGWVAQLVLGVLVVILGIACIFNPLAAMAGVGMTLGLSIVLEGVGLVMVGIAME